MARYRSKYRGSSLTRRRKFLQYGMSGLLYVLLAGVVGGLLFLAINNRESLKLWALNIFSKSGQEETSDTCFKRLCREEIPFVNFQNVRYNDFFRDMNDIQLMSAQRWGLTETVSLDDLDKCEQLQRISTTNLYAIDTMHFSRPYLVPAAFMMLQYIGERFSELQAERNDGHTYRPIVTSALRSDEDVRRLRRRNRNATENSCHCYGTTIDITYTRFMREDGEIEQHPWLTHLLAQVLYELRYEGLCYVRYERRQPCFHITVRNIEYLGSQPYVCKNFEPVLPTNIEVVKSLTVYPDTISSLADNVDTASKAPLTVWAKPKPVKTDNKKTIPTESFLQF